jgi:hypothetical protein
MALTSRDKEQLLGLASILAPIAERTITRTLEAPGKERLMGLKERALKSEIAGREREAKVPQFYTAKGLSELVGGDWSALADKQGQVPAVLAKPIIDAQAMQGRLGIQRERLGLEEEKADIKTLENTRRDWIKILSDPFGSRDLKQQATDEINRIDSEIRRMQIQKKQTKPLGEAGIQGESSLQTIVEDNAFTQQELDTLAGQIKSAAQGTLTSGGKPVSFEELGRELEGRYGFTPTTINHLMQRYTPDPALAR